MADMACRYPGDRDDVLIAYLYDDITSSQRASFDAHVATCERCSAELADLRDVRAQLGRWAPPEPAVPVTTGQSPATSHWWRGIPAWAQVAAALLVLGVAAGLANLDIRYNKEGLTVRTGWSSRAAATDVARGSSQAPSSADTRLSPRATTDVAPWRADLVALEQQLRTEFRAADAYTARSVTARTASNASTVNDAEIIRRVRALLDESERKQRSELALHVAEVLRDVNAQRSADLVRINQSLGLIQNNTGVEVLKNRRMLEYYLRVSQTK